MNEKMKIAIPTEDEKNMSEHFGGAPYFLVATGQHGSVAGRKGVIRWKK